MSTTYNPLTCGSSDTDSDGYGSGDNNFSGAATDSDPAKDKLQWNVVVAEAKKDAKNSRRGLMMRWLPSCMMDAIHADEAEKKLSIILRVDTFRYNLDQGQMLGVMQIYREYTNKLNDGTSKQHMALRVDIIAGVCAVAVPVLIPYAQQYKEETLDFVIIPGKPTNIGTILAILAVVCSLVATILNAFQKTSRTKEISSAKLQEAEETEKELALFLSLSSPYDLVPADDDGYAGWGVGEAYCLLVTNYQGIRDRSFTAMKAALKPEGKAKKSKKALVVPDASAAFADQEAAA